MTLIAHTKRTAALVVTKSQDTTADYLFGKMRARGVPFVRLNIDSFSRDAVLALNIDKRSPQWNLIVGDDRYGNGDFHSVFFRRKPSVLLNTIEDEEHRRFGEHEYALMVYWWLKTLPVRYVDTEESIELASNKWGQLQVAASVGFRIPATLITNGSDEAALFYASSPSIIGKTLGGFGALRSDGFFSVYTSEIGRSDAAAFEQLRNGPAILQQKIDKVYELRVTVVGEQVFACRIDSQRTPRTRLDWRRYDAKTPHSKCSIEGDIQQKLFAMMSSFGVHFVAFDFIITASGEYVFLEMNPSPQWVWIETLTGLQITDALIDLMN